MTSLRISVYVETVPEGGFRVVLSGLPDGKAPSQGKIHPTKAEAEADARTWGEEIRKLLEARGVVIQDDRRKTWDPPEDEE